MDTLGWIYEKKSLHYKAANLFEEAIIQMPKNPTLHYHLGVAQIGLKDLVKAKENLEKALQLDPHFPEAQDAINRLSTIENIWEKGSVRQISGSDGLRPWHIVVHQLAYNFVIFGKKCNKLPQTPLIPI